MLQVIFWPINNELHSIVSKGMLVISTPTEVLLQNFYIFEWKWS